MARTRAGRSESGFTLIELLIVIVIIAILAAIGIPIYLNQREKAYITSIQSTLKNTANYVEGWVIDESGDYSALDGTDAVDMLVDEGYEQPDWANPPGYVRIEANATRYCIQVQHRELDPNDDWRRSTFDSSDPKPVEVPDVCPDL